jgi:hypothetical protein
VALLVALGWSDNLGSEDETLGLVESAGLELLNWTSFADVTADLTRAGFEGDPWRRKFLCVAEAV